MYNTVILSVYNSSITTYLHLNISTNLKELTYLKKLKTQIKETKIP